MIGGIKPCYFATVLTIRQHLVLMEWKEKKNTVPFASSYILARPSSVVHWKSISSEPTQGHLDRR